MSSPNSSVPTPGPAVAVHLLDSAKGHPVQTWHFNGRNELKIGRLEDNDVVVTDPAVSRLHATLRYNGVAWTLESTGKHGVLVDDRRIEASTLEKATTFRLGSNGPTLLFDCQGSASSQQCNKTVEFDSFVVTDLGFNRDLAAEQVRKITDDQSFQKLLEQAAALKKRRPPTTD